MWFLKSGAGRRPGRDEDECPSAFEWNCLGWFYSDKVPYEVLTKMCEVSVDKGGDFFWCFTFTCGNDPIWQISVKVGWLKPPTREARKPELWSVRCLFCWKKGSGFLSFQKLHVGWWKFWSPPDSAGNGFFSKDARWQLGELEFLASVFVFRSKICQQVGRKIVQW